MALTDTGNYFIKKIDGSGNVRVFSGSGVYGEYNGDMNDWSRTCQYYDLRFMAMTKSQELYVISYDTETDEEASSLDELNTSRLIKVDREGRPFVEVDFSSFGEGRFVASVTCNPSGHIIVANSMYPLLEGESSFSD